MWPSEEKTGGGGRGRTEQFCCLKAFDSEALNSEVGRGESVSVLQLVGVAGKI